MNEGLATIPVQCLDEYVFQIHCFSIVDSCYSSHFANNSNNAFTAYESIFFLGFSLVISKQNRTMEK
jgi:hypothetical protein